MFKKGQVVEVNTRYTLFDKDEKVIVLIPSGKDGVEKLHRIFGSDEIMVTRPQNYNEYKDISPTALFDLWRNTNCADVPIFVYEHYKFSHVAENNVDHARMSLEVLD